MERPARRRVREYGQQIPLVQRLEPLAVLCPSILLFPSVMPMPVVTLASLCAALGVLRRRRHREHLGVRIERVRGRHRERVGVDRRRQRLCLRLVVVTARGIVHPYPSHRTSVALLRCGKVGHAVLGVSVPPPARPTPARPRGAIRRTVFVAAARRLVFDARSDTEDLEHPGGRSPEYDDREDDDDEDSDAQSLCVVAREAGCEGDADSAAQPGPEEHHLI